jgi:hypothetical protein
MSNFPVQFNKVSKKSTQTTCWVAWALSLALGKDASGAPATPSDVRIAK